jgi:hypothetical protein
VNPKDNVRNVQIAMAMILAVSGRP